MKVFALFFVVSLALADDLGIRFSKIGFGNVVPPLALENLPLNASHYPITYSTFRWLRFTKAVSVVIPEVCVECDYNSSDLVAYLGGSPSHPSSTFDNGFWEELQHVVDVQHLRRQDVDPKAIMPLPTLWENLTVDEIAQAVRDEWPGVLHQQLSEVMFADGYNIDYKVIPFTNQVEFVRGKVMVSDLMTWAIARVGPINFGLKWQEGRVRPEEMAWKIAQGESTGAPPRLVESILALNLTSPESFTAYPKGCPAHPSWPAMHSAGSACSLWMAVILNLTPQQLCQIKLTDYAVSYGRTVAGVHYVGDNIAGLKLGQEIVARRLPQMLHEKYGSDIGAVKVKIDAARFDWSEFLDSDCAKGLV